MVADRMVVARANNRYRYRGGLLLLLPVAAALACGGDSTLARVEVNSVTPDEVEEGNTQLISILGSGFHVRLGADLNDGIVVAGSVDVTFGGDPVDDVVLVSETEITASVPATLAIGVHDMRVVFSDGRVGSLASAFEVFRLCDDPGVFFHDADGDGFTSMADSVVSCDDPDGNGGEWLAAATADDCADTPGTDPLCGGLDGAVCSPGESEGPKGDASCGDGADNNCNGDTDADELACACGGNCGSCAGCCLEACPDGGCDLACDACTCYLDCDGASGACASSCTNGATCNVDCVAAADCQVGCTGSNCTVDCRDATSCVAACTNSSTCSVDCHGAADCSSIECKSGSDCLLQCDGVGLCGFSPCNGGQQSCPANVVVCNRACP